MASLTPEQLQQAAALMLPLLSDMMRELRREDQSGRIDHRAMGGPPEWDSSKDEGFREWSLKLQAWLVNQDQKALTWLNRASSATDTVTTHKLDEEDFPSEQDRDTCKKFNNLVYNVLVTKAQRRSVLPRDQRQRRMRL